MRFAFGSYNLEDGGLDDGSDERLARQLRMLAGAEADGWALQECKGWADHDAWCLHLAENILGMRGFLARSNHGCDVAVLVRESSEITVSATQCENRTPYWHSVARADFLIGDHPCRLVSAHLAPSSPAVRLAEAEALALVTGNGHRAVIAGGDWNAVPAADPDPDTSGINTGTARRKLDRSAARAVEETGLLDVAACLGDLTPTVGHRGGLSYRCDRLYTSLPPAVMLGYRVVAEDRPESDHRPVIGVFDLDPKPAQCDGSES